MPAWQEAGWWDHTAQEDAAHPSPRCAPTGSQRWVSSPWEHNPSPTLHPCPEGNQRNRGRVSVALCSNAASSLEQGRIRAQLKAKRERKRTEIHGEQCLFLNPSPAPNSSALLPQPVFMCLFLSLAADATRPSSRSQRAAMSSHVPSGPSSAHLAPQDLGLESQRPDPT